MPHATTLPIHAQLATLVYPESGESEAEWKERCDQELSERSYSLIGRFADGSTQGMAVTDNKQVYLVFRGTQLSCIHDIVTDLRAWPIDIGCGVMVHSGAWQSLTSVWDPIECLLAGTGPSLPVNCIGHSLGGMLASLAAFRLLKRKRRPVALNTLTTFGAPAVGNAEFASLMCTLFNGTFRRVVRRSDYIPRIRSLYLMGYRQPSRCFYIDSNERVWCNPDFGYMFWDRFGYWSHSFSDHSRQSYAKILTDYYS